AEPTKELAAKAEPKAKPSNSIEAIIAAAEKDRAEPPQPQPPKPPEFKHRPPKSQPVLVAKTEPPPKPKAAPAATPPAAEPERPAASARPLPSIVARAEASKGRAA